MSNSFLGMFPWAPGGFVSYEDERAQTHAMLNPFQDVTKLQYDVIAAHLDQGDEHHEQNTFAYIPTEQQVGAAIAAANIQAYYMPDLPGTVPASAAPSLAQLTRSLYKQAADMWAEIAVADTEGWGV